MKKIMILIITLSIFSFAFLEDPPATIIKEAKTLQSKAGVQGVELKCDTENIKVDDEIAFNTDVYDSATNQKFSIEVNDECPLKKEVTFATGGLYHIYITRKDSNNIEQNTPQLVISEVNENIVKTLVSDPVKVFQNQPAEITLTFGKYSLQNADEIIFSISSNNDISTDPTKTIKTSVESFDSKEETYIVSITFTEAATYNLWIQRGQIIKKQGQNKVAVNLLKNSPTKISKAAFANLTDKKVSLQVVEPAEGDKIKFTLNKDGTDDVIIEVGENPESKVEMAAVFKKAGIYSIFYQIPSESIDFVEQNEKQIVFAKKLDESIITAATGTNVKAKKASEIKLDFSKNNLYVGDRVIFSISETENISKTGNSEIEITKDYFDATSKTVSVTFSKEGTYNIWIQRGQDTVKQGKNVIIEVAAADTTTPETPETPADDNEDNSNWLSMSFMILTGLLFL